MKTSDLMLGDWVLAEGKLTQVTDLDEGEGINRIWIAGCEDGGCIHEEDIQPIPLTPEILEKNGFERDIAEEQKYSSIMGESFKGFYKIPSIPKKYTGFYLEAWGGVYTITDHQMMRIENVHELQHALKLCGIEKKIIL